jgi:hypothetical protein
MKTLSFGNMLPEVFELQSRLNLRPPTALPALKVDGIFGQKTQARVKEFQRNNNLIADGIVGPKTWAQLPAPKTDVPLRSGINCGTSVPANNNQAFAIRQSFVSDFATSASSSSFLPSLPSRPRFLKVGGSIHEPIARAVYGSSLNYDSIFISDKTGVGNLPFTIAINIDFASSAITGLPVGPVVVMNCGTLAPRRDLLIHESAHAWQSQHHQNPQRFMGNSVEGQAMALAVNTASAPISNADFPLHFPFSTYAAVPGSPFTSYGAEQIANQVEHGVAAIVSHVSSVPAGARDAANETSLATARVGDRRTPGVIF